MKNQFEQHIKRSLDSFEEEYNPADWADMQKRLDNAKAGKSIGIGKGLLIAASVIATSGLIYYFSTTDNVNDVTADNSSNQEKNIVVKSEGENPVQSTEIKQAQSDEDATVKANTLKEKTAVSNASHPKTTSPEKSVEQTTVNNTETKTPVQEQLVQAPVEPSSNAVAISASFRADMSKVCEGTAVQFTPEKADASLSYKWYFGDEETSVEQSPKHIFAEAGIYNVKLQVAIKGKKPVEQKNTVIVAAKPSVRMNQTVSEDNSLLVNFEADADKIVDWKWNFGDNQTSSSQNPEHIYRKYGKYPVSVTAKNSAGCVTVVKKDVNLQLDLNAANGFKPTGDGNNTWMPRALADGDYLFTLTIYDKAGNKIFQTSDKNNPWDGKGTMAGDTFRWIAIVKDKNGDEIPCQGLITIAK